jgi:hypothetical protein
VALGPRQAARCQLNPDSAVKPKMSEARWNPGADGLGSKRSSRLSRSKRFERLELFERIELLLSKAIVFTPSGRQATRG